LARPWAQIRMHVCGCGKHLVKSVSEVLPESLPCSLYLQGFGAEQRTDDPPGCGFMTFYPLQVLSGLRDVVCRVPDGSLSGTCLPGAADRLLLPGLVSSPIRSGRLVGACHSLKITALLHPWHARSCHGMLMPGRLLGVGGPCRTLAMR
jgi:hypothetical protein